MSEGWPDFWIKGKYIELIDTINTVNLIKTIETIQTIQNINLIKQAIAQVTLTKIVNGDFETGDLTGWFAENTGPEYGTVEVTTEKAKHGDYSCKITVAEPIGSATPEIDQLVLMETSEVEKIELYWMGDPDTKFWVGVIYVDGTYDEFYDTNTSTLALWRYFSIDGSSLTAGKRIQRIEIGPALDSVNEGKTFYVDVIKLTAKSFVYQAEKDRTITNFPSEYPLPDAQVTDLKTVSVDNLPSEYPLPSSQVADLKTVSVDNLPSEYPLPSSQVADLKNVSVNPLVVANSGSITASENTDGYSLSVNNDYASLVEFAVSLGGAGEIQVQTSPDNSNWFTLWTKSLSSAGSYADWLHVAFPYFRINVPTTGIDVSIWIRCVQV